MTGIGRFKEGVASLLAIFVSLGNSEFELF